MVTEEEISGQASWTMTSLNVRASISKLGAQMAPVTFYRETDEPVQPYHVSPWQDESHPELAGKSEAVLRGDFFCLPFGFAEPHLRMPAHGHTASQEWTRIAEFSGGGLHSLCLEMKNALQDSDVIRTFFLRDGENVVYDRTVIRGLSGAYAMGHHAVLRLPAAERALEVSTSPIAFGMTALGSFADATKGEIQSLAPGAIFEQLDSVPSADPQKGVEDCTTFPSRRGRTDLLQVATAAEPGQPAWTAAVNREEGYLWFSLRDARVLPSTILWMENCGRHATPWNSRNISLGLEDVCSYFNLGSAASAAPNEFSRQGVATVVEFKEDVPTAVSYLQGVIKVPPEFDRVERARIDGHGVEFVAKSGLTARAPAQITFFSGDELLPIGQDCRSKERYESE